MRQSLCEADAVLKHMAKCVCIFCHKKIEDDNDKVAYKNRYAHRNCYYSFVQETTNSSIETQEKKKRGRKKKADIESSNAKIQTVSKALSNEEIDGEKQFITYMKTLLGTNKLPVQSVALAKNYIKTYQFTYDGIVQALRYWYEDKGNNCSGNNPIGIVPYIYNDAQKYFQDLAQVQKTNAEIDTSGFYQKTQVYISKPRGHATPLIDIESIT